MDIQILIRRFYGLSVSAHISHVNTRSFAAHEALGEFYGVVNGVKDRFIEYNMGEARLASVKASVLEVKEDTVAEAISVAEDFCKYAKEINDEAMINLSGEFEEAVGKLRFLMLLK